MAAATCDAGERCEAPATVHFPRAVQVAGIPGLVQHLCCDHARGRCAGHRRQCPCQNEVSR